MLVGGLYFSNLIDVLETKSAIPDVTWFAGAHFYACRFFEKIRGWRCFGDKVEGSVGAHVNLGRGWCSGSNMCGPCVEFLAKVHRFDTSSTESWADWRRRCSFSCANKQTLEERIISSENDHTDKARDLPQTGLCLQPPSWLLSKGKVSKRGKSVS